MYLLVTFIILVFVLFYTQYEPFAPATNTSIGIPIQYILDPDISIRFPIFTTSLPEISTLTPVLHSANFKFPASIVSCLETYIKRFVSDEFILDNFRNIYFVDSFFVFDINILFTKHIFAKIYTFYIEIIDNESCKILSIQEKTDLGNRTPVVYGKLDHRFHITNPFHLMPPFS